MGGKVQSGFRLAPGGNLRASARFATWWLSAVRNIHLTPSYFTSLTGMLVFCGAAQKSTCSGLLPHLVAGLWGGDGGGAAVDQGGQLVEADDAEEVA